jgi:hypothetical protein
MKKALLIGTLLLLVLGGLYLHYKPVVQPTAYVKKANRSSAVVPMQDGDIIFHISRSSQSKAIQLATHSEYSHCGIVYREQGQFYVFEAVQPVKSTPLKEWIARGSQGHYVLKRLKNAESVLNNKVLAQMKAEGEKLKGKYYDLTFEWNDDKIYCSELVWKIYQRATGIEIGQLEKLSDFDLSHKIVQQKMRERYGNKIPLDQTVISPASIFNSPLLWTVAEH